MKSRLGMWSIFAVALMLGVTVQPAIAELVGSNHPMNEEMTDFRAMSAPIRNLQDLVVVLTAQTTDLTDTDKDGLADTVERAIGTDPMNPDTDFDKLTDKQEVDLTLDPLTADTNGDHLSDFLEVNNVSSDLDGDSIPNAWDRDNDNDGVPDGMDLSPMAKTQVAGTFNLSLKTRGNATYISMQIRPSDPDHLKFTLMDWDWPKDEKGQMRDLDKSSEDVYITPVLELKTNIELNQTQLLDYGIVVSGKTAYLPLLPVDDLGDTVAFNAKMLIPKSGSPMDFKTDMSLKWRITGFSDRYTDALKSASNSKYVTVAENGITQATGSSIELGSQLQIIDQGDYVIIKASNGRYLSVAPDGSVNATAMTVNDTTFFVQTTSSGKVSLKYPGNGKYLTVHADGFLAADGSSAGTAQKFTKVDGGVRPESTVLGVYPDDFFLTGMNLEENHASTMGLYYSSNVTHMIGANMLLSTDFIHNVTNEISDMPDIFTTYGVNVQNVVAKFEHQDLMLAAAGGQMMVDALNTLPENKIMPIAMALEGNYTVLEMSEIQPGSYIESNVMSADLTKEPIFTSRSLRSAWYNTSTNQPLEVGQVVEELQTWGLDNETMLNIIAMVVAWHSGEYATRAESGKVVNPGIPEDIVQIRGLVKNITKASVKLLGTGLSAVRAFIVIYRSYGYFSRVSHFQRMGGGRATISFTSTASKEYQTVAMTKSGNIGRMNQAMKVLKWIGIFVAVGLAVYTFVAIASAYGWTPSGTMYALIYSMSTLAWSLLLITLSTVGGIFLAVPIGLFALFDFIWWLVEGKSVSDMLIDKVTEYFMKQFTKIEARTTIDLKVADISVSIDDKDNNGFDVGDSLLYEQTTQGIVKRTKYGLDYDLSQSYMQPSLYMETPSGKKVAADPAQTSVKSTSKTKTTTYYQNLTFTPTSPAINYGFTTYMKYNYKFFYNDKWWFVLCWCWMNSRESKKGSDKTDSTTTYFDILPGTLDEFVSWKSLKPLDSDGDGLRDINETTNIQKTNPMLYDSDGDGLNDKYELTIGTHPNNPDTDGDGLNDRIELEKGLAPTSDLMMDTEDNSNDTDADGLTDKFETDGWVLSYDFEGKTIYSLVKSDPRMDDADNDGLSDKEEYLMLLNPSSNDTNGNGITDDMDYSADMFEYVSTLGPPSLDWVGTHPFRVETDAQGYIYVGFLNDNEDLMEPMAGLLKYYPNGTFMSDLGINGYADYRVVSDGTIYVTSPPMNNMVDLNIFDKNGSMIGSELLGPVYDGARITIDENNGYLYLFDMRSEQNGGGGGRILQYLLSNWALNYTWLDSLGTWDFCVIKWGKSDAALDGKLYVPEACVQRIFIYDFGAPTLHDFYTWFNHTALQLDPKENMIISNATGLSKWARDNETMIASFGTGPGTGNDQFTNITDIDVYKQFVYVADAGNDRVQKLRHVGLAQKPNVTYNFTDSDEDGITDADESAGWTVTVSKSTGSYVYKVTSDILSADTDNDGLTDRDERLYLSDPRSVDTDQDGISDGDEAKGLYMHSLVSNLTVADSDGDGLGDGLEMTYGSDPTTNSSDNDELSDYEEFMLGSDPTSNDTDQDGFGDFDEAVFGSSLVLGDEDSDGADDGLEFSMGTNPISNDTDNDGLGDNLEHLFGSSPLSNDTDGDGLPDGFEWENSLNATNNDTDGDGLSDLEELDRGLDPFSNDTDGDGVPDIDDMDYLQQLQGDIFLVMDPAMASEEFVQGLGKSAKVDQITPQDLMENHTSEANIVIVGRPDSENGTAGGIMRGLLEDSGEELEDMIQADGEHMAVRYGPWSPAQTVIMLSNLSGYEDSMVLGMLKGLKVSRSASALHAQYLSARTVFELDEYDALNTTSSHVWGGLTGNATFNLTITKYTKADVPSPLASWTGLGPKERSTGRYLDVKLGNIVTTEADVSLKSAHIALYYTTSDLDRNGDGDINDTEDLGETTLTLYRYDEASRGWTKVTDSLDWVQRWGVNTTDVTLYGKEYAGYIWADVTHLSLFGISGQTADTTVPVQARAGNDLDILKGDSVILNGSLSSGNGAITNFTWRLINGSGAVTDVQYGPVFSYTFGASGNYSVVLEVEDSLGLTGADTANITVRDQPITPWTLTVGPVKDEDGALLDGALVSLTVLGTTVNKTTGPDGIAQLVLQPNHIGQNVTVRIEKDGYEPAEVQTRIGMDRKLETSLPALKKKVVIDQNFTLTIGQVLNKKGKIVEGASVYLTTGGMTYSATTDATGYVKFTLPKSVQGQAVRILIKKSGYKTVNYTTTISATGALVQAPPALVPTQRADNTMMVAALIVVALIAVLLVVLMLGLGKKKTKGKKRRTNKKMARSMTEEEE